MASIDDVHSLLSAVNTVTLKRMEDKTDAINAVTLKRMEDKSDAISNTTLKRMEEKADRATGAERDFQTQVRAQLGEIDAKLQRITTAMFTPPPTVSPTPPMLPGHPTVEELSSLESARERARRAREAARATAAAVGFAVPPPATPATESFTAQEACGAAGAAHNMAMIALAEGLPSGYALYYFALADAYEHACFAIAGEPAAGGGEES
jgi:hypothetical protein